MFNETPASKKYLGKYFSLNKACDRCVAILLLTAVAVVETGCIAFTARAQIGFTTLANGDVGFHGGISLGTGFATRENGGVTTNLLVGSGNLDKLQIGHTMTYQQLDTNGWGFRAGSDVRFGPLTDGSSALYGVGGILLGKARPHGDRIRSEGKRATGGGGLNTWAAGLQARVGAARRKEDRPFFFAGGLDLSFDWLFFNWID